MKCRAPFGFRPGGACAGGFGAVARAMECPRPWNPKGGIVAWASQADPSTPG